MPLNNFDYPVSWSDFGPVSSRPDGINEDAEIHLMFAENYNYSTRRNAATITDLSVDISVATPISWVVSSQTSNMDLLKHEQGHYDITALGAREFYNGLVGMSAQNVNALKGKIKKFHERIQAKINRANIRYDTLTNHSQDTQVQQTWDQQIALTKGNPNGIIDDLP